MVVESRRVFPGTRSWLLLHYQHDQQQCEQVFDPH